MARGAFHLVVAGWRTFGEHPDLALVWVGATAIIMLVAFGALELPAEGAAEAPVSMVQSARAMSSGQFSAHGLGGIALTFATQSLFAGLGLLMLATVVRRGAKAGRGWGWDSLRDHTGPLALFVLLSVGVALIGNAADYFVADAGEGARATAAFTLLTLLGMAVGIAWYVASAFVLPALATGASLPEGMRAGPPRWWMLIKIALWSALFAVLPLVLIVPFLNVGAADSIAANRPLLVVMVVWFGAWSLVGNYAALHLWTDLHAPPPAAVEPAPPDAPPPEPPLPPLGAPGL